MTENPLPNCGKVANLVAVDRSRWIGVLRSLLTTPALVNSGNLGAAIEGAFGRNRTFIVSCLKAVHSERLMTAVDVRFPLPPMPLPLPAAQGNRASEWVWLAYFKFVQRDAAAAAWLAAACDALDPTALKTTPADNPEPWWQNEMLILHALHSFALISGNDRALTKTLDCADFHLREIQPDHATNEPWSVHAYASHADGRITAETLLHSAQIQNGGTLTEVAQFIVADAVAALEAAGAK